MTWPRYLPPAEGQAPSSRLVPDTFSQGELGVLAKGAMAIFVVGVLLIGYGAVRYFRVMALDDYRAGYAVGAMWKHDGEKRDCRGAMETLYGGSSWSDRKAGWGEFVVGCEDGLTGLPSASWYQLRGRVVPASD
ncbi:MAG: hypothetical protein ACJ72Y_06800 [Actinomycetes bacterium]